MVYRATAVLIAVVALCLCSVPARAAAALPASAPVLVPGALFRVPLPEMPPTLADLIEHNNTPAMMTVFLPRNYDRAARHPLLIFLGGGNGGTGGAVGLARNLTEEKDFICVSVPLFKEKIDPALPAGQRILVRSSDGKFAWPLHREMLDRLDAAVPNIDPAHRILGGFSNGAHATAADIDGSDGEVARRFSAFFFIEGGGKLEHYDALKGKPFLMVYGSEQSRPRSEQIAAAAKAAGALVTIHGMNNVGHAFPESEYPAVRAWLRGPALGRTAEK